MRVRVLVSAFAPGTGWDTVTLMARLLARVLQADLVEVPHTRSAGRLPPALARLPRRRSRDVTTIVIAPQPAHLYALLDAAHWLGGSRRTLGWVIDSFLTDRIPAVARGGRHFDQLVVTDAELVDDWQQATGTPTSWIPFGSDVLGRGTGEGERPVDLQRVGRQPDDWDDDDVNRGRLAAAGLTYGGRVPFAADPEANQDLLQAAMSSAKFTLSFTNVLSPAAYTHPTREYLTGRWLDAIASGAVVAGVPPDCEASRRLLFAGSTLNTGGTDPDQVLGAVEEAAPRWRPEVARGVYRDALRTIDWRWRFAELVDLIGVEAPVLETELDEVRRAASG